MKEEIIVVSHLKNHAWKQNKDQVREANAAFYHVMNKRFEWFDDII